MNGYSFYVGIDNTMIVVNNNVVKHNTDIPTYRNV